MNTNKPTKETIKRQAKQLHELNKKGLKETSIARCHELIARSYGYRSYNHFLAENNDKN